MAHLPTPPVLLSLNTGLQSSRSSPALQTRDKALAVGKSHLSWTGKDSGEGTSTAKRRTKNFQRCQRPQTQAATQSLLMRKKTFVSIWAQTSTPAISHRLGQSFFTAPLRLFFLLGNKVSIHISLNNFPKGFRDSPEVLGQRKPKHMPLFRDKAPMLLVRNKSSS